MKSKRTKATDISDKVREQVYKRDNFCCCNCGSREILGISHFVSRAKGGLGIMENLTLLCQECHDKFDNGTKEQRNKKWIEIGLYLNALYPNFRHEDRFYKKGAQYGKTIKETK